MANNSLISIIVPVYNTEKYLSECIKSILGQTYTNIEVILVNDGSTDGSLLMCEFWAKKDPRIIIINQKNRGVSSARNSGLKIARGTWVTFIDSDDWIEPEFLNNLISSETHYCDWITSGIIYHFENGSTKSETPSEDGYFRTDDKDGLLRIASQALVTSPVAKLYRRDIINKQNLQFDSNLSFAEDRDFNLRYIEHCRTCVITKFIDYNYRKNIETSLSSIAHDNTYKEDIRYWCHLYKLFRKRKMLSEQVNYYLINRLYNFVIDNTSLKCLTSEDMQYTIDNVDWQYVKSNSKLIKSKKLFKVLLVQRKLSLLNIALSMMVRK